MNNPTKLLRARIEYNELHLKNFKTSEQEILLSLKSAKLTNGTSPAKLKAGREVFAENVENNEINSIIEEMIKNNKKKITKKNFKSACERRAKLARNKEDEAKVVEL